MVYNVTDCRTRGNTLMKEEKNMQDNVYDVLLERGLIARQHTNKRYENY